MLTSHQLDILAQPMVDLYDEYTETVIQDIARRLKKMGVPTATAAWQLQRVIQSGKVYETAIAELSKLTGKSEQVLAEAFKSAGVQTMRFDDQVYRAAGLDPLPIHLSPAMTQVLKAGLDKTGGLVSNLTKTTATSAQASFIHAADIAYLQVVNGGFSYDDAIKRAIKNVAADGLMVHYPSGHVDHLDVAMRRAVLTGVSQTAAQVQETQMDQLGVDLVQTSAHIGARPDHQAWQGKIFSRSGTHKFYPDFVSSTGYGTGAGLAGWNCRHSFYPYFKGISRPLYSEAETQQYKQKTVSYNGQQVPIYDATQMQRNMERKIRYWKRQANALEAGGVDNIKELRKVREWQSKIRDFTKQTGLQRQNVREQVIRAGQIKPIKPKPITPKPKPAPVAKVEKPKPIKATKPKPAPVPAADALRGKDIRKQLLELDLEKENKALQDLMSKEDAAYRKYSSMPSGSVDNKTLNAARQDYLDATAKVKALQQEILEKKKSVLFVKDPLQVAAKFTTKNADALAIQESGVEFFKKMVSNKLKVKPIKVRLKNSRRASYDPEKFQVLLHNSSGIKSVVHELGHHLEFTSPGVLEKAIAFYEKRTQGEKIVSLRNAIGKWYGKDEKAKLDKFSHPYMGKTYTGLKYVDGEITRPIIATELVSMGIEQLYLDPINFAKTDPEYFDFMIDLLRGY